MPYKHHPDGNCELCGEPKRSTSHCLNCKQRLESELCFDCPKRSDRLVQTENGHVKPVCGDCATIVIEHGGREIGKPHFQEYVEATFTKSYKIEITGTIESTKISGIAHDNNP